MHERWGSRVGFILAWILWIQPQAAGYVVDNLWRPLDAYPEEQSCRAELQRRFKKNDRGEWVRMTTFSGHSMPEIGVCLPETVQPGRKRQ
jgi:hypothetical protein